MEKKQPRYRLQWLTGFTAVALLGIIALQGYWLNTSYEEEKDRFRADAENALIATLIKTQFMTALAGADNDSSGAQGAATFLGVLSTLSEVSGAAKTGKRPVLTSIVVDADTAPSPQRRGLNTKITDTDGKRISPTLELKTTREGDPSQALPDLPELRKNLAYQLRIRSIETPVEVGLADSNNHIYKASCDVQTFNRMPVKTTFGNGILDWDNARLQAAFPEAHFYLLRKMAWLLSVTALLILLVCASFVLLVNLFFRQKRLAEIRNDFLNNMTHELKTPISSVSVALELMQDKRHPLSEDTKQEYLSIAQGELKRLTMLVEKVLKMAAFEKSEIRLAPESFLAVAWLQNILGSLRPVFEAAGAQVSMDVQPELLLLYADKVHLTNILQNLLENALKYNGTDEPKIRVSIYAEEGFNVLKVTDNGNGIPATYLGKVFDKFFRVPVGDRHDTKGYGLGLSYVKAIAELHGGIVSVSSTPGVETAFYVRLPKGS